MTSKVIESIRKLQEHILEVGLARAVLSLPAPRMMALPSPTSDDAVPTNIFSATVSEPEIEDACRDLFASGHYSLAVQEAYKAVDKFVNGKSGLSHLSGTKLMELVFSPDAPILFWSDRKTNSERDEQAGYHRLYGGAMLGIRNPVTHEFNWIDDPEVALELIIFAQHLLRKAKEAKVDQDSVKLRSKKGAKSRSISESK